MTGGITGAQDDVIEQFLDRLLVSLSGSPRQVRHTLAEVEAHLRDAAAEGVAAGLSEQDAQLWAVERMGPVHEVTGGPAALTRPSGALLRRLTLTACLVGGAGLAAVGGAGLIGRWFEAVRGNEFLTAPWPPGSYTQADCARWLAGDPGTHSCVTAMLADHAGDIMMEATAAGVLGVLILAVYVVLRMRWRDRATMTALPAGSAEALGAALAGLAAVACFGVAWNIESTQQGMGAGTPWSFGLAATAAALAFALALWRARSGAAR
jgi:hypothetical protein